MLTKTLSARLSNFFAKDPVAANLSRLKGGIESDYDARTQAAEKARAAGIAEVKTVAEGELAAVEAAVASAKRRAVAIQGVGVLCDEGCARAEAVASIDL